MDRNTLESKAMATQWLMWRIKEENMKDERHWIGQMERVLHEIGWGTTDQINRLEHIQTIHPTPKEWYEAVEKAMKSIIRAICKYAINELRDDLKKRPKYEFMMATLPSFEKRYWLEPSREENEYT